MGDRLDRIGEESRQEMLRCQEDRELILCILSNDTLQSRTQEEGEGIILHRETHSGRVDGTTIQRE